MTGRRNAMRNAQSEKINREEPPTKKMNINPEKDEILINDNTFSDIKEDDISSNHMNDLSNFDDLMENVDVKLV